MDIESIVTDCKKGNTNAFGKLYNSFSRQMLEVIDRYIHDKDIAKDILHDGFIIAFTSISSLKDGAKAEAWLTRIMRNLSLQYLRKQSENISVPLSETAIPQQMADSRDNEELSWEQLEAIIDRLPEGYNKVFRLNVLEGLSHKEIAQLLGISHLTSASQLHRAKVMLRRMINDYRIGIGVFSLLLIISICLYNLLNKANLENSLRDSSLAGTDNKGTPSPAVTKPIADQPRSLTPQKLYRRPQANIPEAIDAAADTVSEKSTVINVPQDSVEVDSVTMIPDTDPYEPLLAYNETTVPSRSAKESDWSLSVGYSGATANTSTRNLPPDLSLGDPNSPPADAEQTEHIRYYMPLTFSLSLSKALSERWAIESGLRYTYLRSDKTVENRYSVTETIHKAHYLGIPLKVNYNILTTHRFSLYGQGGAVLDIPLHSTSTVFEKSTYESMPSITKTNLHIPAQWSIEGGIGVEYRLTPSISIYAEPSFKYYLNSGSEANTLREKKPLELTLPLGLKLTW